MESLFLQTAPPLDPAWLAFEEEFGLNKPRPELAIAEHQVTYAAECRSLNAKMLAPGARDHHLSLNVTKTDFTVPSTLASLSVDEANCYQIPVIRYQHASASSAEDEQPDVTVLYIHGGGGLYVGEADSEELSCLRILKATSVPTTKNVNDINKSHLIKDVYSLTYPLMPTYSAQDGLSDCLSQEVPPADNSPPSSPNTPLPLHGTIHGVLLRCPVTSDAFSGLDPYVPLRFRHLHTSAWHPSFWNLLLGQMKRTVPRDGLERMPLETEEEILKRLPRTWIQLCTNDSLYSDGVCYAKALEEVGVEVRVDVVRGWPHTFWLKAPGFGRALEAEEDMVRGFVWLLG
ncbi:hypothetical protein N0V85_004039 [Neurospora sp. IMI 360204]|nr:hypothetical protein N0V85_004039 [Neurospora sp. IMI 360204]